MKAQIKTDTEKFIISKLTKETGTNKYYLTVGATRCYMFFEGQTMDKSDAVTNMVIVPFDTTVAATGSKMHNGMFRFYCYGKTQLMADQIVDALSAILDEQTIDISGSFRIETSVMSTKQRNKFSNSTSYENICQIEFWHWGP